MKANGWANGAPKTKENRRAARYRTRLRPCRIFDARNRFLADCALYDISTNGARVRMLSDDQIPPRLRLVDDQEGTIREAHVVWRRDREVGLRFV